MEGTRYSLFEHTADLGVEFYGSNLNELYENAAYALADIMVGVEFIKEEEKRRIKIESYAEDELFIDWLRELIYIFTVKEFLFRRAEVTFHKGTELEALLYGEQKKSHKFRKEIKTPTYHQFTIKKEGEIWKARVIFDV